MPYIGTRGRIGTKRPGLPCPGEKREIAKWKGRISSEDQNVDREKYRRNYDLINWGREDGNRASS